VTADEATVGRCEGPVYTSRVELRRERDDPNFAARCRDLGKDLVPGEVALRRSLGGHPQALERLRAFEIRIDEVALEMSRKHSRGRLVGTFDRTLTVDPRAPGWTIHFFPANF